MIIFLLLLTVLIFPLFSLLVSGFQNSKTGSFSLINFEQFFAKRYYTRALFNSLKVGAAVTSVAVLLGTPIAYFMTFYEVRFKRAIQVLIIISMMSPSFIGAYSWVQLLGRSGLITKAVESLFGTKGFTIYGFGGIVLVLSLKLYPFIYMYVSGALKKIDRSLLEASQSLGCSPALNVIKMILPLILPTLLAASLMVFMTSIADFGTPMLIGEGYRVMPVLVYREYMGEMGGNANFAASMAFTMIVITMSLYFVQRFIINRKSYKMRSVNTIQLRKLPGKFRFLGHAFIYLIVFLSVIPQITVVYTSFLKTQGSRFVSGFSLESYQKAFQSLGSSITNTYLMGGIAIAIIIVLGILMAYLSVRKRNPFTALLDVTTMFPYIISGSVLGIMLLMAFNKRPLILTGTYAIIIIAFVIRRLPHTLRSSVGILYQINPNTEDAAISLGAPPAMAFFEVTMKLMLPGVLTGAILSWITIINELSASVILYTGGTRTMSVSIYSEVLRGNYGTAAALASLLTLTTVISLLLFFRFSKSREISL